MLCFHATDKSATTEATESRLIQRGAERKTLPSVFTLKISSKHFIEKLSHFDT
jgi:hypothetical protein